MLSGSSCSRSATLGSFYSERSALRDGSLLWPLLTSGRNLPHQISPGKNDHLHRMQPSHLHHTLLVPSGFELWCVLAQRAVPLCASCSSARGFASGFLQTPASRRRPCLQLTVPVTKVRRGLSPPSDTPMPGTHRQRGARQGAAINGAAIHETCTTIFLAASSCINSSGGMQRSCGRAPFCVVWPRAIIRATIDAGNAVVRIIAERPVASS
jgi:hypothetical protein